MKKKRNTLLLMILLATAFFCGCGSSPAEHGGYEYSQEDGQGTQGWSLSDLFQQSPKSLLDSKTGDGMGEDGQEQFYDEYFLCDGTRYAYSTLSETEKIWYRDMEKILGSMAEEGTLSPLGLQKGLTADDIDPIFQCVMMDHPELFFVEGYVYSAHSLSDKLVKLEFSGTYQTSREVAVQRKAQIEVAADTILRGVESGADDYQKIKYVYETLIRETDYSLDAPDNQNIYSVLIGKLSVCQGYAKATQYLLNKLGVECTLVSGNVQGGNRHGWNLVKADGDYYYVDTTWGDASYQTAEETEGMVLPDINYDYLCVTTRELELTHRMDENVEMPLCTAIKDNYFVKEGAYFTEPDSIRVKLLFQVASPMEAYRVNLKCASRECYDNIRQELIEDGKVFEYYLGQVDGVVYVQNDEQYSMTFWVTNR